MAMTMRWVKNHGKDVVRVDFGKQANGKRRVRFFPDEKQAKAAISKYEKDREAIGKRWANLPVEERLGVVQIIASSQIRSVKSCPTPKIVETMPLTR